MSNFNRQGNNANRKPIPLTQFDVFSNWLYADAPVAGAQKPGNFRLKVIANVPRFIVKTNVPDDKDNGRIEFQTDIPTFMAVIKLVEDLAEGREEGSFTLEYNDHVFGAGGQRSEKPVTKASIKIGKDKESGRIYIAVLGYNRPKIQFFFGPAKRHDLKGGDGSVLDAGFVSRTYARACVKSWSEMALKLLNDNFDKDAKNVAKPPAPPQGQGGGNGYQGGGNNQRQQAASAPANVESFDDFGDDAW
jgi:hypothetical protein|tara:strand:+ start:2866 stop:3606 length:741 start_codon:yes stop_codon:yes gene_type:complete